MTDPLPTNGFQAPEDHFLLWLWFVMDPDCSGWSHLRIKVSATWLTHRDLSMLRSQLVNFLTARIMFRRNFSMTLGSGRHFYPISKSPTLGFDIWESCRAFWESVEQISKLCREHLEGFNMVRFTYFIPNLMAKSLMLR